MPWKEWNIVEERLRFIARLLDGEKMAPLCINLFGASHASPLYPDSENGPPAGGRPVQWYTALKS
jgi:hypothetical protein